MNDEPLDHLLALWHAWQQSDKGVRGFNRKSLVIGDIPEKRGLQYESQLEAQDIRADNFRCKQVDHEVRHMPEPYQSAVYCIARNLYTGRSVWLSPRLPADKKDRDIVICVARSILTKRLKSSGVI